MSASLCYWDVRGRAQPIKLLLEFTGEEYKEKRYPCAKIEEWFDAKYTLGLDFPNLPYYIDGDVKLSQTYAILKYIARKHDLVGTTEDEKRRIDLMEAQAADFLTQFALVNYQGSKEDYENVKKAEYVKGLPAKWKEVAEFLGSRTFFAGNKITYVDFIVYEILDIHKIFAPECLDEFPTLGDFQDRIEALPPIAAFINSPRFITRPIFGPMAHWQ